MGLFVDGSKRAGRFLEWKVRIFVVGGTLAVGGIYLNERWLTGAAILVLVAGMLLRFIPRGAPTEGTDEGEDDRS